MACSRDEFLRWLTAAIESQPMRSDEHGFEVEMGPGAVRIDVETDAPRRLGAITLPMLRVTLSSQGVDQTAFDAFVARLDLYCRRGGG